MFKNINDIYVITLKKDTYRLDHFIEQAEKQNITNYKTYYGFDGEHLELNDQLEHLLRSNDYNYRAGIVGCALSHYSLWRKIINLEKNILIFEDDVVFNENINFSEYWNSIVDDIPDDFGIIYLNKGLNLRSYESGNKYFTNIYNAGCMTTCAYYINYKLAKIYCDLITEKGIYRGIDGIMMDIFRKNARNYNKIEHIEGTSKLKAYILKEPICNNFSDHKFKSNVNIPKILVPKTFKHKINVHYINFWSNFSSKYNFFTQYIQNKFNIEVISDSTKPPDVVFSSIFGNYMYIPSYGMYNSKSIKKILYTGEDINIENLSYDLCIGFTHSNNNNYLRVPLWFIMIDWYNTYNPLLQGDPDLIPYDWLERGNITNIREQFCIFVCSDKKCWDRNKIAQIINKYKKLDCGGKVFNNIIIPNDDNNPSIGRYTRKIELFKQYKFAYVAENAQSSGYCTEKILHAFSAGCIPIYWGDKTVINDFNPKAFINCNDKSYEEITEEIMKIDTNDELYLQMRNQPVFINDNICNNYFLQLEEKFSNILAQIPNIQHNDL